MVGYDPIFVAGYMPRAVDWWCDGVWNLVSTERDVLIREAASLVDEASELLAEQLPQKLHDFVDSEDVCILAAALAVESCEGWNTAEEAMKIVERRARERRYWARMRGDVA